MKTIVIGIALLVGTFVSGCVQGSEPNEAEFSVTIFEPSDNLVVLEGESLHLQAQVAIESSHGTDVSAVLGDTAVVWYSDVAGVLAEDVGSCASWTWEPPAAPEEEQARRACWLVYPVDHDGQLVWSLITSLPPGHHVLHARAVDTLGGRAAPAEATIVVNVLALEPPEIHVVQPEDHDQVEVGSDLALSAWISDDIDEEVEVTWSSSLQGVITRAEVSAPDVYTLDCHAGGVATEDEPCHLSNGTHVLTLAAVDGDGATSHSFITLTILPPSPADAGEE